MPKIVNGAMVWRSGLAIDADGSPRAYHPDSAPGLDYLADAGKEGKWWGVVTDNGQPSGSPVVQGPADPCPGFYVAATSLVDRQHGPRDPRRYVDSENVPYATCTKDMLGRGVKLGDVVFVAYGALTCGAVVADVGPRPGEGSIALARTLGIPSDPRHGGLTAPAVSFVVFLGSSLGWPVERELIESTAQKLFVAWGGFTCLAAALS